MSSIFSKQQQNLLFELIADLAKCNAGIDIPEIVVCGDTSSGKSTLLSAITGVTLPTASGICTKCPTRIRMKHSQQEVSCFTSITWSNKNKACKKKAINQEKEITDLEKKTACECGDPLTQSIRDLQTKILQHDEVTGGVSHSVIEVEISSPDFVDFTIIDLPGTIKTVGHDQDSNIAGQIDILIHHFLINPLSIILAVHPGTNNFQNSDILNRAGQVDPKRLRTLPVVTKADAAIHTKDHEEVINLVCGKSTRDKFSKGFHLVMLHDPNTNNNNNVRLSEVANQEMGWFEASPYFGKVDNSHCGVLNLRQRLAEIYFDHVKSNIERVLTTVKKTYEQIKDDLEKLGADLSSPQAKCLFHNTICNKILKKIETVSGGCDAASASEIQQLLHPSQDAASSSSSSKEEEEEKMKELDEEDEQQEEGHDIEIRTPKHSLKIQPSQTENASSTIRAEVAKLLEKFSSSILPGEFARHFRHDATSVLDADIISHKFLGSFVAALEGEIRRRRHCAVAHFESKDVFNRYVQEWITCAVAPAAKKLGDDVGQIITDNMLCITVTENMKDLELYRDLDLAIRDAVQASCSLWKHYLEDRFHFFLEQEKLPHTLNHYFTSNLVKNRNAERLAKIQAAMQQGVISNEAIMKILSEGDHRDLVTSSAEEVAHTLHAYYKVARKRIIDVVAGIVEFMITAPISSSSTPFALSFDPAKQNIHEFRRSCISGKNQDIQSIVKAHCEAIDPVFLLESKHVDEKRREWTQNLKDLERIINRLPEIKRQLRKDSIDN